MSNKVENNTTEQKTYKKTTLLHGKVKRGQKTTFLNTTKKDKMVDNEKLYETIKIFIKDCECDPKKMSKSQYEWLGKAILNIIEVHSLRPQFKYYPYREDMVQSACIQVLKYLGSFNYEKYNNPVSWIMQVAYFIFIGTINDERRQLYVKMKSSSNVYDNYNEFICENGIEDTDFTMDLESLRSSSSTANITMNDVRDWCKEYEAKYIKKGSTATDKQEANDFDDEQPKSKKRKPYKPRQSKGIKKLLLTEAIVDNDDDGVCLL